MADPSDRERRDRDEGLSSLAKSYRSTERYVGAAFSLVVAVGGFAALGYWLDRKLQHEVPWLLLVGAAVGMTAGFISFFRTVLGKRQSK